MTGPYDVSPGPTSPDGWTTTTSRSAAASRTSWEDAALGLGVPAVDQRRVEGRRLSVHLTWREVGLRVDRADVDQSRDRRLLAGGHDMTRPADVDRLELGGDPRLDGDQRGEVEDRRRCRVQAVEQAAGRLRVADVTALGLDIEPRSTSSPRSLWVRARTWTPRATSSAHRCPPR